MEQTNISYRISTKDFYKLSQLFNMLVNYRPVVLVIGMGTPGS